MRARSLDGHDQSSMRLVSQRSLSVAQLISPQSPSTATDTAAIGFMIAFATVETIAMKSPTSSSSRASRKDDRNPNCVPFRFASV